MWTNSLIYLAIGIALFLKCNHFWKFTILTLSVFFPLTLGNLGPINGFLIYEWIGPIFFIITFINKYKFGIKVSYSNFKMFNFAILLLLLWSIINYMRNPVMAERLFGVSQEQGGLRTYYDIFIHSLIFISTPVFLSVYGEFIDIKKWLKTIVYFSLLLILVRIPAYFLNFEIPFLTGTFAYNPETLFSFGGFAFRIGGLSDAAGPGLAAFFCYGIISNQQRQMSFYIAMIFILAVFLSGGRAFWIGLVFAFGTVAFFIYKKPIRIVVYTIITAVLILIFAPKDFIIGQTSRLSSFSGGIKEQDQIRYIIYNISLMNFLENPVFGKGIGADKNYLGGISADIDGFIIENLKTGGHGSYMAILSTFGIGGAVYFLIMLYGGIIVSFNQAKRFLHYKVFSSSIALFCLILLLIKAFEYLVGWNGVSDPALFFLVGLISFLKLRLNDEEYQFDACE
jgi:hypothetical protein